MKRKMKRGYRLKVMAILLFTMAALFVGAASFAWFSGVGTKEIIKVGGHVRYVPEYFGGGDGTQDKPYLIQTKEHYANFVWLQYMGYFNDDSDNDGTLDTVYFKLDPRDSDKNAVDTLDMSGCVLPPAGTSVNPFIGNFDGNYKTIANLTVTNASSLDGYYDVPEAMRNGTIDSEVKNVEIVGVFGVVGSIGETTYTYDISANAVKNLNISGTTIKTATSEALAGISAGYVNGTLMNVGVVDSNIDNTNGSAALSYTTNLSDYTLVGYCTEPYRESSEVTIEEIERPVTSHKDAEEEGAGYSWGGSVAMHDFYNRVKSMSAESNTNYVQYPTDITITKNENDGTVEETINAYGEDQRIWYYTTEEAGSAAITSIDNYFAYLYGYNEIPFTQKVTETGLLYDPAYFISDGNYYLCVDSTNGIYSVSTTETSAESQADTEETDGEVIDTIDVTLEASGTTSKWQIVDPVTGLIKDTEGNVCTTGYLKTTGENPLYLNKDANNHLTFGTVGTTIWNNEGGKLYILEDVTSYFLECSSDGVWSLTSAKASQCYITDGTNYMGHDGIDYIIGYNYYIENLASEAENGRWVLVSEGNNRYSFQFQTYLYRTLYLQADNNTGNLSLTSRQNSRAIFTYENGALKYIINNNVKYLTCDNDSWKLVNYSNDLPAIHLIPPIPDGIDIGSKVFIETYDEGSTPKEQTITKEVEKSYTTPDTYLPINASSTSPYSPDDNNTGYIISGAQSDTDTKVSKQGDIRLSGERYSYWNLGYSNNNASLFGGSYVGPELQVITQNANSNGQVRIIDDFNKDNMDQVNSNTATAVPNTMSYEALNLQKYADCRAEIGAQLTRGGMYGMHFMNAAISKDNIVTIPKAHIAKTDYTDYEMPRDCIDFVLQDTGFINFFAGSYHYGNNAFFSLHQIFRDGNRITDIKEIQKIYEGENGTYVYEYTDGTTTGTKGDLVFDLDWIKNPSTCLNSGLTEDLFVQGALYYYEIPVNAGEYALGSVEEKVGAYLLYLDIGSNAQRLDQTFTTETMRTVKSKMTAPKGVDILTSAAENSGADTITNSAAISIPAGNAVNYNISKTGETITLKPDAGENVKDALVVSTDGTVKVVDEDANALQIKRDVVETKLIKRETILSYNVITSVQTESVLVTTNTLDKDGTLKDKSVTTTVTVSKNGEIISQSGPFTDTESAETITMSDDVILGYHYIIPATVNIDTDRKLTFSGYTQDAEGVSGKYDITVKATTSETTADPFNIYVDKVDTKFSESTINEKTMVTGDMFQCAVNPQN